MTKEILANVGIYPLVARTATPTPAVYNDYNHPRNGGQFVIDTTAIGAAPSVVFNIEGFDVTSGKWYPILVSAAVVATGTIVLRIYPGETPAANLAVSDYLPPQWRVRPVHGNADSITYSVGVNLR
jgi:hypothetical protein